MEDGFGFLELIAILAYGVAFAAFAQEQRAHGSLPG
jgi:hypothetical protein